MSTLSARVKALAANRGQEVVLCFRDGAALSAAMAVAAIQELDEVIPSEVWGTSSGALVGSGLAQGMDAGQVEALVRSINVLHLVRDLTPWQALRGGVLLDWTVINQWLDSWLKARTFRQFDVPMHVMTSVQDEEHKLGWRRRVYSTRHTPDELTPPVLRASMAVKRVFRPVMIGNQLHIDGANATSKTWKEVVAHANGRQLLIIMVNPVFAPRNRRWKRWVNPTARPYPPIQELPGGHLLLVLNCQWGDEHPFAFQGTLGHLQVFRQVVRNELTNACTLLERAGDLTQAG